MSISVLPQMLELLVFLHAWAACTCSRSLSGGHLHPYLPQPISIVKDSCSSSTTKSSLICAMWASSTRLASHAWQSLSAATACLIVKTSELRTRQMLCTFHESLPTLYLKFSEFMYEHLAHIHIFNSPCQSPLHLSTSWGFGVLGFWGFGLNDEAKLWISLKLFSRQIFLKGTFINDVHCFLAISDLRATYLPCPTLRHPFFGAILDPSTYPNKVRH